MPGLFLQCLQQRLDIELTVESRIEKPPAIATLLSQAGAILTARYGISWPDSNRLS